MGHLPAFTSAVGYHERFDWLSARKWGMSDFDYDHNYDHYDYIHYGGSSKTDQSYKSPTVHGDRTTPYRYTRIIDKVTDNRPTITRSTVFYGSGVVYDEYYQTYISHWRAPFNWNPLTGVDPLMRNACDESEVKALNDLSNAKASLGASLATVRQTVDMFSSNASTLAGALLAARRGRWGEIPYRLGLRGGGARSGKTAASRWLELQYGWLPLMSDIRDAQTVLHQAMNKLLLVTGRGKGSFSSGSSWKYDKYDFDLEMQGSAKSHLTAKVDSPLWHNLDSAGLINPLSVAWEVVPWSFAIDWFVPVGATLEALTATAGLSFVRGHQSCQKTYTMDIAGDTETYPYRDFTGYAEGFTEAGHYQEKRFEFDRYPFGDFPKTKFFADLTPYSTPRALNALALVRQLFR